MNRVGDVDKSKLQKAIETTNFSVLKDKEIKESFNGTDIGFKNWRNLHSENKNFTLIDGTLVQQKKCTKYDNGFIEYLERPCSGSLLHPSISEYFYKGNDRINCL